MTNQISDKLIHGAIGGLLAGAAVALWFLVVDLSAGEPFRTPATLAAALLGEGEAEMSPRLVIVYTVLHFAVFAFLGQLAGFFLAVSGLQPGWLLGAVFGLGVLDAVHYGALLLTGQQLITVLPPVHVLAANLLGGVVLMTYLHQALDAKNRLGVFALGSHPLLAKGLVTGLVGAGAVALWFLISDILMGRPFWTPAALGSVVFFGADSIGDVQVDAAIVAAYTVVHILVFLFAGTVCALAVTHLTRAPGIWLILTLAFITLEAVSIPVLGLLGGPVLGRFGIAEITVGNLIAVISMGYWLWRTSPELRRRLQEAPVATRV